MANLRISKNKIGANRPKMPQNGSKSAVFGNCWISKNWPNPFLKVGRKWANGQKFDQNRPKNSYQIAPKMANAQKKWANGQIHFSKVGSIFRNIGTTFKLNLDASP
ncbi:MAG: hypothetical protein LIP15_04055 [Clostridium sp.]|nr:hypothetical protein [Clostridium sp.]